MSALTVIAAALQLSVAPTEAGARSECPVPVGGLTGVVAEISGRAAGGEYAPSFAFEDPGNCGARFNLFERGDVDGDALETPIRFATFSRLDRPNDGTGQSSSLGVTIQFDNADIRFPSMAIVAGVDRRTVFLAPGLNGFQQPVVNLSDSLDVADGYGGVAWRLSPERFVSVSYVRQERSFNSGMSEWREQDHFVGFVFNQRW
ncbi:MULTISPECIES: hypothetical protein [Hyphobacterium]|uniref:Uncharacterized protein n=1 Tax=Hyphobacterium vulgare TaxID=1736751 RepID=A0ABV6ZT68_9PROT